MIFILIFSLVVGYGLGYICVKDFNTSITSKKNLLDINKDFEKRKKILIDKIYKNEIRNKKLLELSFCE